ncbi:ABC transporter substrate-binding protein [Paenibacillus wulumuqiensis]|uniref:ABC transporter substrate-binding protein n=1 Tax=Paenibacillus wulumuqiensis TaxID=1567107 RepID=UPI0006195295|nr:ABC transporter substrate-binding protein [Paenibacillus wulumuqiensis]
MNAYNKAVQSAKEKKNNSRSIRSLVMLVLAVCLVGMLAGCGSPAADSNQAAEAGKDQAAAAQPVSAVGSEQTVTDEQGHQLQIPAAPQRVFAPYLEDSLLTLGVTPVAQWSSGQEGQPYLEDQLKDVPKLDFSSGLPSPELVMNYKPDLIILHTSHYAEKGVYESYSKIAPVYVFNNASGDPEKSLQTIAGLLGKQQQAEQAIQQYKAKLADAKAKIQSVTEAGKKAAIIRFAPRGVTLMSPDYFSGYVVYKQLGLGQPGLVQQKSTAMIATESLADIDADYIFTVDVSSRGTNSMQEMTSSEVWKSMPAVRAGHVYEADSSYWLGSGLIAFGKVIDDVVAAVGQ